MTAARKQAKIFPGRREKALTPMGPGYFVLLDRTI
jgi:hypothetical protein